MARKRKSPPSAPAQSLDVQGWTLASALSESSEQQSFLWRPRIPRGCLTLITGLPECGKSCLLIRLVGAVTSGVVEDVADAYPPAPVVYLGAEDGWSTIVKPRLKAASVNLWNLVLPAIETNPGRGNRILLPGSLTDLERVVLASRAVLVVLDPIAAYVSSADLNQETAVREILDGLQQLAQRTGAAVCCTRNFNKRQTGQLLSRINGSAAWRDVPRSILCCTRHPRDPRQLVLVHGKSSGPLAASPRLYEIVDRDGVPFLQVGAEADLTIEDCEDAASSPGERAEWAAAHELLVGLIGRQWTKAAGIYTAAQAVGIGKGKVWRAKAELAVPHRRVGFGPGSHVEWGPPRDGWPAGLECGGDEQAPHSS
jgi:AAA domain